MSLKYGDVIGKEDEWGNMVTNVAMINAPFLAWCPLGAKPAQARYDYQAETFKAPARNSHPDGAPVQGATSAGDDRVQLSMYIQYSTKAASVGRLQQDFGNNAAVSDELAKEVRKQTEELRNDMENACLSAQECRLGVSKTVGYMTRGVPNWIQRSAQTVLPVDATQYPAAAQVDTTATASLTEDVVLNLLEGIGNTTKSNETVTAFCGPRMRRAFDNFPVFTPAAASTVNGGAYPRAIRGGAFDKGIKRYVTPYGFEVDLVTSWNNFGLDSNGVAQTGTTYNTHGTFFLHQSMWEFRWGQKPNWINKTYEGGQYEAFCETIWQLLCLTPKGEGKYAPAT